MIENKIPLQGNIIIEIIKQHRDEYEKTLASSKGISNDFLKDFMIVADSKQDQYAPINCGKVKKMASDAFGEAFAHRYGVDTAKLMKENVKEGTTVYFVPNQSQRLDPAGQYHMISDFHVLMIEEKEEEAIKA